MSVIIPCWNEQEAIEAVLNRFIEARQSLLESKIVDSVELIVVDDGSQDESADKAENHASAPLVIRNLKNLGYGGAIKEGLKKASGSLLTFYDMDFTYDPMDLIEMIQCLDQESVSVVCGDRLSRLGKMPLIRTIGNNFFISVTHFLFGKSSKDCCTGLRVFKSSLKQEFIDRLPNDLNYTLAMTLYMYRQKISFREIPISYSKRIGRSKLSVFIDGPRFLFTIISYRFKNSANFSGSIGEVSSKIEKK